MTSAYVVLDCEFNMCGQFRVHVVFPLPVSEN
jgi:hypothetical protein